MTKEERNAKYHALAHAIQSAIAYQMNYSDFAEPKHLRVGIDITKGEQGGLARLLIAKGLITEDEYLDAMIDGLERELEFQTKQVHSVTGHTNITFK
jgi:hypothetical protein